jgi:membrane protease subunit (stomatin/prohibitin family)
VTSTTTSIPEPVTVTTSATVTTTATTRDTTAEMLYGWLMAVFLALFLGTLVMLVVPRFRGSKGSNPQPSQAAIAAPASTQAHIATSHKCSACGTEVDPGTKFCENCGAQLRAK